MNDAVRIDDLCIRLGECQVLDEVTLRLPAGSMLAVLGPNGSGKSTLLRALVGLVPVTRGSVRLLGAEPGKVPPGSVGFVPQLKSLDRSFPARAVDLVVSALNGRWPGRATAASRDRALETLTEVGAGHLANRSVGDLSGGELQRVYLARAVSRRPQILLLDEPEAGVDTAGTADLHSLLDRYRATHGTTIVLVTHDWSAAQYHATHVLVLRNRLIAFGPAGETFAEEPLLEAFGHVGHRHDHPGDA